MGISYIEQRLKEDRLKKKTDLYLNPGKLGKSEGFVTKAFQTLTKTQIQRLIKIYQWDFEAFEYDSASFERLGVDI